MSNNSNDSSNSDGSPSGENEESAGMISSQRMLFGHPTGLYTLFFAEMWERFSYYGMRALLVFYMIKGFMGLGDTEANAIYGAYTALVYMTPFFGGLIADKLIGARSSVVLGGVLMALGHLLMTWESELMFFSALGLLIVGNGFFKPNISTIVGSLYPAGSPKRDGGFTIFYIGINLGAAMAPLLCGYVGETYGWHYGFGIATIGMLVGLAVFVAPNWLTQIMIASTAIAAAIGLFVFNAGDIYSVAMTAFVAVGLLASGAAAVLALSRGGIPAEAGITSKPEKYWGNMVAVLLGTCVAIPILVILVSGLSVLPNFATGVTLIPEDIIKPLAESESALVRGLSTFVEEASRPAGLVLIVAGILAFGYLLKQTFSMPKIGRERMYVVFVLTFFSLLFWAFFEQSGSSVNNFTDRNIDRVFETSQVSDEDVGKTVSLRLVTPAPDNSALVDFPFLSQEFLGHENDNKSMNALIAKAIVSNNKSKDKAKQKSKEDLDNLIEEINSQQYLTMTALTYLREYAKSSGGINDKELNPFDFETLAMLDRQKALDQEAQIAAGEVNQMPASAQKLYETKIAAGASEEEARKSVAQQLTESVKSIEEYAKQIGSKYRGEKAVELDGLAPATQTLIKEARTATKAIQWKYVAASSGRIGLGGTEIPASVFQSVNPIFIVIFGLIFTTAWTYLASIGMEPSTPTKFALGLMQLGLGFAMLYFGAQSSDSDGMVAVFWLILMYLLLTTGELCLSPVGLSMITKLAPGTLISSVMGAWFLATAFSSFLAAIIAQFAAIKESTVVPIPKDTVNLYGDVYGMIACLAVGSGIFCLLISPILSRWMHVNEATSGE